MHPIQPNAPSPHAPISMDRNSGQANENILKIAANALTFIALTFSAPAALGSLGFALPIASLTFQALGIKDSEAAQANLADEFAASSGNMATIQAAAVCSMVAISSLGFFVGALLSAGMIGGATWLSNQEETSNQVLGHVSAALDRARGILTGQQQLGSL